MKRDTPRPIAAGFVYLLRGLPTLIVLVAVASFYLVHNTIEFFHPTEDEFSFNISLFVIYRIPFNLNLLTIYVFLGHFLLLKLSEKLLPRVRYSAPFFERKAAVRITRFYRRHIEKNLLYNSSMRLCFYLYGFMFVKFLLNSESSDSDGSTERLSQALQSHHSLLFHIAKILFIPIALACRLWAFPIMFFYLDSLFDDLTQCLRKYPRRDSNASTPTIGTARYYDSLRID